jgi:hypothetical protein
MSERLPYEERLNQQWNDLPLPDETRAWADMKRRLDEDDDKPPFAWWNPGCALWGLLLLLIIAIGWWFVRPEKRWFGKNTRDNNVTAQQALDTAKKTVTQENGNQTQIKITDSSRNDITATITEGDAQGEEISVKTQAPGRNRNTGKTGEEDEGLDIKASVPGKGKKPVSKTVDKPVKDKQNNPPAVIPPPPGNINKQDKPVPVNDKPTAIDTLKTVKRDEPVSRIDSASSNKTKKDSANKVETPQTRKSPKQDPEKIKAIYYSAGLAINQQLPVAGQTFTPFNAQGREGSLLDYIPSVYFRLNKQVNKKDKWFLQSEFRYGAPQYTKELLYQQTVTRDSPVNVSTSTVTSKTVKKTYYHQLPLSFNYYVLPNWSVGSGLVWNHFTSALTQTDISKRDNFSGTDTLKVKGPVVKESKDSASNFTKDYFQAILETQYKWRRFSLGARYTFGLNPYIKFTLPGGTQQQEKNNSLTLFLRYELWKSKPKILKR